MTIEWEAENVRLSLFSNAPLQVTEDDWRAITGQAEAANRQAVLGGRVFTGPFQGGQLSLSGANNRIDVILTAAAPTEPPAEPLRLPTIGRWEPVRGKFVDFASDWLTKLQLPIVRIAFGTVLLCKTSDRDEAYQLLKRLLSSVNVDTVQMKELLYRINWTTESKVFPRLLINRITNWSVIQIVLVAMQLASRSTQNVGDEQNAVRLEIDHSTDAKHNIAFPMETLSPIFLELISLASQNAERGERP